MYHGNTRPHAPIEVESAMVGAKAKAVKNDNAALEGQASMIQGECTIAQMKAQRVKGYIIEGGEGDMQRWRPTRQRDASWQDKAPCTNGA